MADDNLSMLLTNAGAALLARVIAGEKLTFTRGAFGDSFQNGQIVLPTTDEQAQMEQLINERIELPLTKITSTGAYAEVDMHVATSRVDNSFMISEIGLFAKIGDEPEKLYGYFNAGLKGDYMPASHSAIAKEYTYTVIIAVGNAQNVTAIINRGGADYILPTASASVKGGVKIGNGLSMNGDTLNVTASGGGLSNPVEGTLSIKSGDSGGFIDLSGDLGGYINLSGLSGQGGTVDLSGAYGGLLVLDATAKGGKGGTINLGGYYEGYGGNIELYGAKKGGVINLAGKEGDTSAGGSIKGYVHFTDRVFFDNGATGISSGGSLPTASTSIKGGVKIGNGLSMNGDTLNVTASGGASSAYTLPTASASIKGGVKLGDEFYIVEGGEMLRLSGKVNSRLDIGEYGFSLRGGNATLDNANIKLYESTVSASNAETQINLPNVKLTLGSSAHPLTLNLEDASLRVDDVTLYANSNTTFLNANTPVKFQRAVTLFGNAAFENEVDFNGDKMYFTDDVIVNFGDNSSLYATRDYIDVSNATINGNAASISGNVHFTGTPVFDNGATGISSGDSYTLPTASTTQKGGVKIGTGLSMDGETLNCTVTGGSDDFSNKHIYGKNMSLEAASAYFGISQSTIAGSLRFKSGAELKDAPKFTDGLQIGSNKITQMKIENGRLVITIDGTTVTLGGSVTLDTVASTTQGGVWLGDAY